MKKLFTCLVCLVVLGLIYSCQKGGIPFYMSMNWGHVNTTSSDITAGDTTHFISDVWVQTSSTNLGAYQLPCNFPVLDQYNVHFLVNAGVWESGQQEVRVPYPFYTTDTFTVENAQATHQYSHHPVFSYLPACTLQCRENFESGLGYDSMTLAFSPDTNVKYGTRCGVIALTASDSDIISTVHSPFPANNNVFTVSFGQEVWMELDYKAQVPFWIGVNGVYSAGEPTSSEVLFVLPTSTWTKLYVKLTDVVSGLGATYYFPYFEAQDTVGGSGGNVYLDNIKVVHF